MESVLAGGVTEQPAEEREERPSGLIAPTQRRRSQAMIGDVIVDLGFARRETVDQAVALSRERGRTTGELLLESGAIRPDQLARALAERFGVDYVDLAQFEVDPAATGLVDHELARRYAALPIGLLPDGSAVLAMADPTNVLTIDELSMIIGRRMRAAAAPKNDILKLISRLDRPEEELAIERPDSAVALELTTIAEADGPAVKLVHQIITQGVHAGASDIHFDPQPTEMPVMFRVDGVLTRGGTVPRAMAPSVVSRIKIMGGLDIAERRVPQDGRMAVTVDGRNIDVRVVSLPLVGGEGIVMRILDTGAVVRDLKSLGMPTAALARFEHAITQPYGAVLVTGPTGSGKSTTLYAGLSQINDGERSVVTIEDPVESPVEGVKQMQVAVKAGVTFATGLRAILRADPDVIMVGEIRDRDTAEIAIQAALTGHLMLSTLHTRDAVSALTRLIDMGVEPFMVAAAIDCVVAQRLMRTLCTYCRTVSDLPDVVREQHGLGDATVYEARGCVRCAETGYSGRVGIYEVMPVGDEIRSLLLRQAPADEIAAAARQTGMRSMYDDGLEKVAKGVTSLLELTRVTTSIGQAAESE